MQLQRIGDIIDLSLEASGHVSLSTHPYDNGGHHLDITFYDVDPQQVLEEIGKLLKAEVMT